MAYAGEVRAFHTFFGAVLILVALLHLFIWLPYLQLRDAAPALASAEDAAEQEVKFATEATRALEAATAALAQFRRSLEAAPSDLHATIGSLVALGRSAAGPDGDPYRVTVRIPKEILPAAVGASGEDETLPVDEAIRRLIGRRIEALSMAFDATLEPLQPFRTAPPEVADVVRTAEEGIARNVLALNEVLREAFAADRGFWQRLRNGTTSFAPASARAEEWTTSTFGALRLLETRLSAATVTLKEGGQAAQTRLARLGERNRELRLRLETFSARLSWLPMGLDGWARLYPLVTGGLALTVLFRLRRILMLRRALAGIDVDVMAPSWVLGASTAPGRWWAMLLVALPLLAATHASFAAVVDPGLYATLLGEPSPARRGGYATVYVLLVGIGLWQLVLVGRGIFGAQSRRQAAQPARGGKG